MRTATVCLTALLCVAGIALAAEWDGQFRKFSGGYFIYGGALGDTQPPTAKDVKVAFSVHGAAAKQMFDAMGPDRQDTCGEGSGMRVRHKDEENLSCRRSKEGVYQCNFGFDLRTGKSIGGIIC